MFYFAIIYDSDKRYIVPFEIIEKYVDEETIDKIKTAVIKEVEKNA